MKRFTILVAILSLFAGVAGAKGLVSYQGEIDLGYAFGYEEFSPESVNLHTIQGIKVGKYFSTGIGSGLDFYYNYDDTSEVMVPLYLNVKGYLPLDDEAWSQNFCVDTKSLGASISDKPAYWPR